MPDRILIDGGRRQGRTLQNEAKFRAALAEGKQVFTGPRNGVWFSVDVDEADDSIIYTALTARPEGL